MAEKERVKILILGPSQSGKTVVANWISGFLATPAIEYKETRAARLFEFDVPELNYHRGIEDKGTIGGQGTAAVQLWDVSGNVRYRACWPATQHKADGIIFVMNPDIRDHDKTVQDWYKTFIEACDLHDSACVIFSHNKDPEGNPNPGKPRLTRALAKLFLVETALPSDPNDEAFRPGFKRFVENCIISRRDRERQQILDAADREGRGAGAKTTIALNKRTEIR